jgi:acyl CoA:acetate/3-ketoacid CoA transferase alpha subunit
MLSKLCQPKDMLHHFPNGAYIGWSGFTGVGYPKYVAKTRRDAGLILFNKSSSVVRARKIRCGC